MNDWIQTRLISADFDEITMCEVFSVSFRHLTKYNYILDHIETPVEDLIHRGTTVFLSPTRFEA